MKFIQTKYKGKIYKFMKKPFYDNAMMMFEAPVVGEDNTKYLAYFDIIMEHDGDEEIDLMCDWDNATGLIKMIYDFKG